MGKVKIAVFSDTHALGTTALCPSHQIPLPDGGFYTPNKTQKWLFQCWEDYWKRVAEVEADKLIIVSNGDAVEGDHHGTPQIISRDLTVQTQIIQEIWQTPLALKPDAIYVVNGTESHVKKMGASEKSLAGWMESDGHPIRRDPSIDAPTWWRVEIEVEGVLFNFVHQGRTGYRSWTFANAANLLAADIFMGAHKRGVRPPDLAVRAHFHRWNDSFEAHPTRVVQLGCWQAPTTYVQQRIPEEPPGYGGIIITVEDGRYEVEKCKFFANKVEPCQE